MTTAQAICLGFSYLTVLMGGIIMGTYDDAENAATTGVVTLILTVILLFGAFS